LALDVFCSRDLSAERKPPRPPYNAISKIKTFASHRPRPKRNNNLAHAEIWAHVGSPPRADPGAGAKRFVWTTPSKQGRFGMLRRGRVRSCVRPMLRGLMTAGPDAIGSLAPQQIYALEWRITLDGFFQAPGSTGSAITPPSPSLTHQLWQPLMGF